MKIDWTKITPVLQQVSEAKAEDEQQADILAKCYAFLYVAEGFAMQVQLAQNGDISWDDVLPAVERSGNYCAAIEPTIFGRFNVGTN